MRCIINDKWDPTGIHGHVVSAVSVKGHGQRLRVEKALARLGAKVEYRLRPYVRELKQYLREL